MSRHPLRWARILVFAALVVFGHPLAGAAAQHESSPPANATPASGGPPAAGTATGATAQCRVGVDLIALHDLDMTHGTFGADFWVWSVCPNDTYKPLSTMEFIDADSTNMSYVLHQVVNGTYWTQAKITGTFRHPWDLTKFPFGGQQLVIEMEDAESLATEFTYVPDVADSIQEPDLQLDGWRVTASHLAAGTHRYVTTFGDPRDPGGVSDFPRLTLTITLGRQDKVTSFFKLTFVVYIAFLISLISYFLNLGSLTMLTARLGVISGTLFAVAVNLRSAQRRF